MARKLYYKYENVNWIVLEGIDGWKPVDVATRG